VSVRITASTPDGRASALRELRSLIDAPPPRTRTALAGPPVLNEALDGSSREIARRFFPLLLVVTVVLLALTFRDLSGVVAPLSVVALCEVQILGLMGYLGIRLNLVLVILPPLVFVIALTTAVHILIGHRDARRRGLSPTEAVLDTYREKGWAVFWTGMTTAIGFAALATSRVGPVRSLGTWSALAMLAMTATMFLVYPAVLAVVGGSDRARVFERAMRHRGRRWAEWAARRRGAVLTAAALVVVLALAGMPRIRIESNAIRYLDPDHPVRTQIEDLEASGIGSASIELLLERDRPGAFLDVDVMRRLSGLGARLRELPSVLGVVTAGDLLDDTVLQSPAAMFYGAEAARQLSLEALRADPEGPLRSLVGDDGRRARVTVFTPMGGVEAIDPLIRAIERRAAELFPAAGRIVTGEYPLLLESQHYLLRTLALSLSLTLLCVALILRAILGTSRMALLALVPNLWPVLGFVGLMGWLDIPLDIATTMVASIVLGLAVDDTIHTLGHFRELAPRLGRFEAVAGTLERTAPAYVLTGAILAAGFGVCSLSSFAPTARFGLLCAAAIGFAVLGDLLLLPALLGSAPQGALARMRRSRRSVDPRTAKE
jgi:predicted RND superfamily exporter protein